MNKARSAPRRPRLAATLRALLFAVTVGLFSLHCVEGGVASNGCPRGETCSAALPDGLLFLGPTTYDGNAPKLGPLLVGGRMRVQLYPMGNNAMVPVRVEVADGNVVAASMLPSASDEDPPTVELTGLAKGSARVSVVEVETGLLVDFLDLDVLRPAKAEVTALNGADGAPIRGCQQMLGVQLIVDREGTAVRAIDQNVSMVADGVALGLEAGLWDCFLHTVPEDATSVTYEVIVGEKSFFATLQTRTLSEAGLQTCPGVTGD